MTFFVFYQFFWFFALIYILLLTFYILFDLMQISFDQNKKKQHHELWFGQIRTAKNKQRAS